MRISLRRLNDKRIVDTEGSEIGTLRNITVDVDTGILTDLMVKPAAGFDTSGLRKENSYIFIPFDAVKAVKDVIIVESGKIARA